MDWAMVILFVHADGCYSWQWTQTQKNKPQKLFPQSSPCSALIPWVEGLFLGNGNGKWCITELPGFHFLPILMQNGSCSCSGKPRHGDSAFLSPNWWHWAQNLKNCYKCCNLLRGWGCIWEPLCLFFFPFFLHLLVKLCFCFIQTGSWEVLSDSVRFKAACDLSSF